MHKTILTFILLAAATQGQTTINGSRSILGQWNAGGAARTVPLRMGPASAMGGACANGEFYYATDAAASRRIFECRGANNWQPAGHYVQASAPAECALGEVWFDSDAAAGLNWFGCTGANIWTPLGASGGGWKTILAGGGGAIAANGNLNYLLTGSNITSSTERFVALKLSSAGTLSKLRAVVSGVSGAGGVVTCTVFKGVDAGPYSSTGITAATSGTGDQGIADLTNTATVAAGDQIYLKCTGNAALTAANVRNWTLELNQ